MPAIIRSLAGAWMGPVARHGDIFTEYVGEETNRRVFFKVDDCFEADAARENSKIEEEFAIDICLKVECSWRVAANSNSSGLGNDRGRAQGQG